MALIDEAKTWLRVSTADAAINSQIQLLIDAAISDLTNTADVVQFNNDSVDPLIKNAIFVYCAAQWSDDEDRQAKLMQSYDSIKAKLATSQAFGGSAYSGGCNG